MMNVIKSGCCILAVSVPGLLAACSSDESEGMQPVNSANSAGPGGLGDEGSATAPSTTGSGGAPSPSFGSNTGRAGSNGLGAAGASNGPSASGGSSAAGGSRADETAGSAARPGSGGADDPGAAGDEGGGNTAGASALGGSAGAGGSESGAGQGGFAGSTETGGSGSSDDSGDAMRESAGCGQAPTLTSGSRTIQSGGQSRSYILRIPDNYDNNEPHRLVFGYHWNGGTMQDVDGGGSSGAAWSYYGLREQAGDSTVFVAPQGIGNGWQNAGGQDLTFTDDMLALIQDDLCIDTRRIFALGFSYGGGMSYALACARPDVFRAVAVYSGGVLSGCEGGMQPVAYMGIHGLTDSTLNISGGRSMRDRFVMNNGCTPQDPPEPSQGSLTHTCTAYEGCAEGYPVEWCAFDGGHTPGMVDGGGDDGARTWTKAEVWRFFSQFE
jgi:poly(3-hydroxybutyrate) depolymerase